MLEQLSSHRRLLNATGFLVCMLLIAVAYYLQFVERMEPCPLCIFQRIGLVVVGLVFLMAAVHHPNGRAAYVYAGFVALVAMAGAMISARHLWLQSLPPDQVPACGPGLGYLLDTFPLGEAIRVVLQGSGECAQVDRLFGLSIPAWTLMAFLGLGFTGLLVNYAGGRVRNHN